MNLVNTVFIFIILKYLFLIIKTCGYINSFVHYFI